MSAAEVEAVHASQLEELQHSTLDWMALQALEHPPDVTKIF